MADLPPTPRKPRPEGPGVERSIGLTDAVVAIAMTLLVLPLVEVAGEVDVDHVGTFFAARWNLLLSFGVSFLVIHAFWTGHASAYRKVRDADVDPAPLRPLTMWWLLLIAFLPFPTAVVGRGATTTSVPLYVGTMLAISLLTSAVSVVAARATGGRPSLLWTWLKPVVFAVCVVVGLVNATGGLLTLLLFVLVAIVEGRTRRRTTRG